MFKPISLYIGLRYTRAKRRNHFISFISLSSMLGIALGVAVLITVMSVMNGFDEAIKNRILGMARHISVSDYSGKLNHWKSLQEKLMQEPGVISTAPFVNGQGMLANEGMVNPAIIIGILPKDEKKVSDLENKMLEGSLQALKPQRFGIIIGYLLAERLGLSINDKVTLITSQATLTPAGIIPRFKRFTVVGIFKVGNGAGFDDQVAFMHLSDAQTLFQLSSAVSGIRLKIEQLYDAPQLSKILQKKLPENFLVTNWTQEFGAFFSAISLEKRMMFLILALIIAVAAFNLVSSLVMVVTDKKADIAILRTLGASPMTIMKIFMVQGSIVGIMGTLLGLIGGIILALNVSALVNCLEQVFHLQLLSSDIYYVNYLPSKLDGWDTFKISFMALSMSLLATLYPAWRASKTQPAEALRYE
ncbi:MAG: Lipoprotein-releasing system transmembrane protein LolE [Legionellaceae bacterium]